MRRKNFLIKINMILARFVITGTKRDRNFSNLWIFFDEDEKFLIIFIVFSKIVTFTY